MDPGDGFRVSDAAVVARYLQLRGGLIDRLLARVEQLVPERYDVRPTRRVHSTLVAQVRGGFERDGGGEVWPVVFLGAVDITPALCVQITPEQMAGLGTRLNGPARLRHRHWDDWWGWEKPLSSAHPPFFDLPGAEQEEALVAWYVEGLEWLANSGLLRRK
jgi:hypothetical protein